ncbi:MAG: class I SAM-dependent methyltransferase [Anaerolineaceae bacterium]|nr:class I SAM-dependent methyltransferase [Anaerolineaceae bacterium]
MDEQTIHRLNAINREFYRITAVEFDQTRGQSWPGWDQLLPYLAVPLHVLDVGCGNGRFGVFLAEHLDGEITYRGVDNSPALLVAAGESLAAHPRLAAQLEIHDILSALPDTTQYDLIVLFGVLHHVPGTARRVALLRDLAGRLKPGGLLAFACWRFYEYSRFKERIQPWPDDLTVEQHDYLLDWRRGAVALRYCHYVDDAEHAALTAATGLTEIVTFRADGFTGDVNRYSVLQK